MLTEGASELLEISGIIFNIHKLQQMFVRDINSYASGYDLTTNPLRVVKELRNRLVNK